eukprot:scaffold1483_cov374-Pavlova_lutheri.AAC.18
MRPCAGSATSSYKCCVPTARNSAPGTCSKIRTCAKGSRDTPNGPPYLKCSSMVSSWVAQTSSSTCTKLGTWTKNCNEREGKKKTTERKRRWWSETNETTDPRFNFHGRAESAFLMQENEERTRCL